MHLLSTRRIAFTKALMAALAVVFTSGALLAEDTAAAQSYDAMSLEELLDQKIVTATNSGEKLVDAPATVIVITRDEILQRGYSALDEIFDDLPGMQVSRSYGDTWLKNYWRGYRNNTGEPFLVMLDGVIFNQLYNNQIEVINAMPLTDVERIEVVYGPASSTYGANAFMGVVNILTTRDRGGDGGAGQVRFSGGKFAGAGTQGPRGADMNYLHQAGDFRLSLSARADYGSGDWGTNNGYEFSKDSYYADRRLWGALVDSPQIAGAFYSPKRNLGLDARLYFKEVEMAAQMFQVKTGFGEVYAGDRTQNNAIWDRVTTSLYLRDRHDFNERLSGVTLLRYDQFDIKNDSFQLDSSNDTVGGVRGRYVQASNRQSLNHSWSVYQDFNFKAIKDVLAFSGGFKYEQKNLQKAYDLATGTKVLASAVTATTPGFFPAPPVESPLANNRTETEDYGVYLQTRYRRSDALQFTLGVRNDHNSRYGALTTIRGGYVGRFGDWGLKALYGEGFSEPSPQQLYGGRGFTGVEPTVEPEKSSTTELSGSWTHGNYSLLISGYRIDNDNTIVNVAGGADNLGERRVIGVDLHGQALIRPRGLNSLRLWGYYSRLFTARETVLITSPDPALNGTDAGFSQRIGDLSGNAVRAGVTAAFSPHLSATIRGRWIGARPTQMRNPVPVGTLSPVHSNPVYEVGSYATFDFNLVGSDLGAHGLGFAFGVENLANRQYFEPGIHAASAGITPGGFNAGVYTGSAGRYNSLLPQPGRLMKLTLKLDF